MLLVLAGGFDVRGEPQVAAAGDPYDHRARGLLRRNDCVLIKPPNEPFCNTSRWMMLVVFCCCCGGGGRPGDDDVVNGHHIARSLPTAKRVARVNSLWPKTICSDISLGPLC